MQSREGLHYGLTVSYCLDKTVRRRKTVRDFADATRLFEFDKPTSTARVLLEPSSSTHKLRRARNGSTQGRMKYPLISITTQDLTLKF